MERTREDYIQEFEDFLDDCYEPIKLFNIEYSYSEVLKKVDPVLYDMALNDYIDYRDEDDEDDE